MEPVGLLILMSLFVPGTCEAATPDCLYGVGCCETVGQSCTIQPQGMHCEQRPGGVIRCFDMGNAGCVRYYGGLRTR